MTIRRGGPPRGRADAAPDQAHVVGGVDGVDRTIERPPARDRRDRRRPTGGGGRGGFGGLVRFVAFALVLGAVVLVGLVTVLRPVAAGAIVGWASDNPTALGIPFVADLVREDLGASLTAAPSTDATEVDFIVAPGDTARGIAARLQTQGLLIDARAFVFTAIERSLTSKLEAGTFILRRNMTPDQLVTALLQAKSLAIDISFREGLRVEQMAAKLETLPVTLDPKQFYDLAMHPTASILAAHPWLQLPKGASLEGFLYPATYQVLPSITPEQLIGKMLDAFYTQVGQARVAVPASRGLTFYQVVTMASLVEQEARLDAERPLIAGVFQNRLDPKLFPTRLLQSDTTIFYINDTVQLAKIPFAAWAQYSFWGPLTAPIKDSSVSPALAKYDTYTAPGLMPGPICSPSLASIDAVLHPDTATGYLYFVARNDGSNTTAFARTLAQHEINVRKYSSAP
ncbi:MAG: endolytic transglycosylase MltG [Chloroflexi bacterium]|nr:endolytic transglycosylase MltG [Chloroflexota bacterium]